MNSGSGVLTSGDQPQELHPGATFSLPEGASFSIENKSDTPISIRVNLLRAE
jgi:quercetin dioxygenase-like cupin family protein